MGRIYLDYAATTPVDPRVLRAMQPYFSEKFGNPSSLHSFGQQALAAVDASRELIAKALNADFREIIFTGSATESNNIALRGSAQTFLRGMARKDFRGGLRSVRGNLRPRIIISAIEHGSVRETARDLEREGVEVVEIPVDRMGFVNLKKLEAALNERTVLVSVIYANNEIGTIQPISKIAEIIRDFRNGISNFQPVRMDNRPGGFPISKRNLLDPSGHALYPILHTDAVQAFQFLPCVPSDLGVDLMTLSAHKIYGPKGIGLLYVGSRVQGLGSRTKKSSLNPSGYTLYPIITGGGQEFGLRSGTENVPLIVGFAEAVRIAVSLRERETVRIQKIRDYFWKKLQEIVPQAELNGGIKGQGSSIKEEGKGTSFLPNILNVRFPGQSAEHLITKLDLLGVAVSSGSACNTRASRSSYVLEAVGFSQNEAKECVRFSFGRLTSQAHIDAALKKIKIALQ